MSNKENLWRLQDEEGKPVVEKPKKKNDIKFMIKKSNGKYEEVMQMQSISFRDIERSNTPIREIGTANPVHWDSTTFDAGDYADDIVTQTTARLAANIARQLDREINRGITYEVPILNTHPLDLEHPYRTETIRRDIPDILNKMVIEVDRYHARFYSRPSYISLDKEHYHSFWIETRQRDVPYGIDEQQFMGLPVLCNVTQGEPVMALGSAMQEGIEGRLYREQS